MARPWIRMDYLLHENPKTLKLSRITKGSINETIGRLYRLWAWCMRYNHDADFSKTHTELEAICEIGAGHLIAAGFMDKDFKLHDWNEYTGKSIQQIKRHNEIAKESIAEVIGEGETMMPPPEATDETVPEPPEATSVVANVSPAIR